MTARLFCHVCACGKHRTTLWREVDVKSTSKSATKKFAAKRSSKPKHEPRRNGRSGRKHGSGCCHCAQRICFVRRHPTTCVLHASRCGMFGFHVQFRLVCCSQLTRSVNLTVDGAIATRKETVEVSHEHVCRHQPACFLAHSDSYLLQCTASPPSQTFCFAIPILLSHYACMSAVI